MPCYLLPTARPAFIKMNNYVGLGVDAKIVLGAHCTALPLLQHSPRQWPGYYSSTTPECPSQQPQVERAEYPNVSICEIDHWRSACTPPIRRPCVHSGMRAYTLVSARGLEAAGRPGNDFGSFVSGFHENREQKPHLFRNRLTNKVRCGAQAHTSLPQCRAVPRFRWAPWRAVRRCGMRSWAASSW